MSGPDAQALRVGGPRPAAVAADGPVHAGPRRRRITNAEEVILGRAIDLLDDRTACGPAHRHRRAGGASSKAPTTSAPPPAPIPRPGTGDRVDDLVFTLDLLCTGSLAGVFDQADLPADRPGRARGQRGHLPGRRGRRPAAHRRDAVHLGVRVRRWSTPPPPWPSSTSPRRRSYLAVMDELWRALRGAPGLVEYADALTRLNRAKGMATIMITHSLADLDALPTEEDRAKARGFVERCAITVLGGLPPRELARVSEITPLTGPEQELVTSWSAPDSWQPGARHPGRGKYLIKTGERLGIPVELSLVGAEHALYDTDQAIRRQVRKRRMTRSPPDGAVAAPVTTCRATPSRPGNPVAQDHLGQRRRPPDRTREQANPPGHHRIPRLPGGHRPGSRAVPGSRLASSRRAAQGTAP